MNDNTVANSPVVAYDQVINSGGMQIESGALFNVVLGGSVDLDNTFWDDEQDWLVFDSTGTIAGTFNLGPVTPDVSSWGSFTLNYDTANNNVSLHWAPVIPELSNLLVGGLLGVGLLRRKRGSV